MAMAETEVEVHDELFGDGDDAAAPAPPAAVPPPAAEEAVVDDDASEEWKAHVAWLAEMKKAPLVVTVSDPEQISGSWGKSWTVYKVSNSKTRNVVKRRFSDFDWLREALRARFLGVLVPPLPEKKVVGNTDETFIRQRMRALNTFMQRITANPYLVNSKILQDFLTAESQSHWETVKRDSPPEEPSDLGAQHWHVFTEHYELPEDSGEGIIAATKEHLEETSLALLEAQAQAKRLLDRSQEFALSLQGFQTAVETWKDAPALGGDFPSGLEAVNKMAVRMTSMLERTEAAVDEWTKLAMFQPSEISIFLHEAINDETAHVNAFREMLKHRDVLVAAFEKAWHTRDKHQTDLAKLRDKGAREDKIAKVELQIAEDDEVVAAAQARRDAATVGVIFTELTHFSKKREERFRLLLGQFAVLSMASAVRTQGVWKAYLDDMNLDHAKVMGMAKETLRVEAEISGAPGTEEDAEAGAAAGDDVGEDADL